MPPVRHGPPDPGWDSLPRVPMAHPLQSRAWARFQSALGNRCLNDRGPGWTWSGQALGTHGLQVLYAPCGPTSDGPLALEAAVTSLRRAAVDNGADFVRVEPRGTADVAHLRRLGASPAAAVQPEWTRIIDPRPDEDVLRRGLSKGHRSTVTSALKRGVTVRRSSDGADIEHFIALLPATTRRGGFHAHSPAYFRRLADTLFATGDAHLLLAHYEEGVVAAALVLCTPTTRAYAHAVADQEVSRRLGAATLVVWQLLLDAHEEGAERVDLYGVAPPEAGAEHPWHGLSAFKRSFGGVDERSVGAWEFPVHRLRYAAYRITRRLVHR